MTFDIGHLRPRRSGRCREVYGVRQDIICLPGSQRSVGVRVHGREVSLKPPCGIASAGGSSPPYAETSGLTLTWSIAPACPTDGTTLAVLRNAPAAGARWTTG